MRGGLRSCGAALLGVKHLKLEVFNTRQVLDGERNIVDKSARSQERGEAYQYARQELRSGGGASATRNSPKSWPDGPEISISRCFLFVFTKI